MIKTLETLKICPLNKPNKKPNKNSTKCCLVVVVPPTKKLFKTEEQLLTEIEMIVVSIQTEGAVWEKPPLSIWVTSQ